MDLSEAKLRRELDNIDDLIMQTKGNLRRGIYMPYNRKVLKKALATRQKIINKLAKMEADYGQQG